MDVEVMPDSNKSLLDNLDNKKKRAIRAYIKHGTISAAVEAAGICRATFYNWIDQCPDFAQAVESAKEQVADQLEHVAIKRACEGSDTLLIFLLKGHKPEKFKERAQVDNNNSNMNVTVSFEGKLDEWSK